MGCSESKHLSWLADLADEMRDGKKTTNDLWDYYELKDDKSVNTSKTKDDSKRDKNKKRLAGRVFILTDSGVQTYINAASDKNVCSGDKDDSTKLTERIKGSTACGGSICFASDNAVKDSTQCKSVCSKNEQNEKDLTAANNKISLATSCSDAIKFIQEEIVKVQGIIDTPADSTESVLKPLKEKCDASNPANAEAIIQKAFSDGTDNAKAAIEACYIDNKWIGKDNANYDKLVKAVYNQLVNAIKIANNFNSNALKNGKIEGFSGRYGGGCGCGCGGINSRAVASILCFLLFAAFVIAAFIFIYKSKKGSSADYELFDLNGGIRWKSW